MEKVVWRDKFIWCRFIVVVVDYGVIMEYRVTYLHALIEICEAHIWKSGK